MEKVKTGIDNIDEYMDIFKGKKVGLITNNTGYNCEFKSTIDILRERTNLTALYSPEHGIRGDIQAGEKVESYIDSKTGIRVYSLYGKNKRPSKEILKDVDILAFDIQDVGARFYTYLYTMSYAMESCSEFNKEFVVFDRPNPINGVDVEGNLLDENYSSFVGRYPIPQRYGLTIAEIASLFNEEFLIGCKLKVIPLKNWNREMYYEATGLNFIMPSPNMPSIDTAVVYPGTCIFEGTNISEGRGTTRPFEIIGAPWLDGFKIANKMNRLKLYGVKFRPVFFTPTFSKHVGKLCRGIQIHVTDRKIYKPVKTGMFLYETIKRESKDKFDFVTFEEKKLKYGIDYLAGNSILRKGNISTDKIYEKCQGDSLKFKELKKKYHLY
ncbi:exo-beta-N-acetylmuramidase NamZ family protein [Clostridium hydrogenum]|uniref:exo-beta-N-acetylmuramidase NamZ family protein n=1 Tax=Clostridium hydrogenum TaxID=2855764 RepID=UPI001F35E418|nr:DUF1343 domain-containing protein [Clostridium hydrogenum]